MRQNLIHYSLFCLELCQSPVPYIYPQYNRLQIKPLTKEQRYYAG